MIDLPHCYKLLGEELKLEVERRKNYKEKCEEEKLKFDESLSDLRK